MDDETNSALSNITLRWIVREATKCNPEIQWDQEELKKWNLKPNNAATAMKCAQQERLDAISQQHSVFDSWWSLWWVLEWLPSFKQYILFGRRFTALDWECPSFLDFKYQ